MKSFIVKFHDGRIGNGTDVFDAIKSFMKDDEYKQFIKDQGTKGYTWTGYIARESKYETCTINFNGKQIAQVFCSPRQSVIKELLQRIQKTKPKKTK